MNMDEKMSRLIFYFTGTGNCLYVARQLADDNTELLSIPQLMKQKELNFEADEIGLVYPIYGHMPPYMVRQFLKKAKTEGRLHVCHTHVRRTQVQCRGDT